MDSQGFKLDAWRGGPVSGTLGPGWRGWALSGLPKGPPGYLRPSKIPSYEDCTSSEVGWGLVVADNDDMTIRDKADGADLPDPLRSLLEHRHGIILRHRPENSLDYLRRYTSSGNEYDVKIASPEYGVAEYKIPYYLLLYGDPGAIPWEVQFHLNLSFAVGRLHLTGAALASYVDALIQPIPADGRAAVIWSVDHGTDDITSLLYDAVASPLANALQRDDDLRAGTRVIHGHGESRASSNALYTALEASNPGLVVTTSHGVVPDNGAGSELGLLVDDDHTIVRPADLLARWQPRGAIWYAHACCSAGSDGGHSFAGFLAEGSDAAETFARLAGHAATIAPMATAILSAPSPARAFVGHVEPTFDLTVRDQETGAALASGLVDALYRKLYQPFPIGHCLRTWYGQGGAFLDRQASSINDFNNNVANADERALLSRIAAADHRTLVVIGDPAAALDEVASEPGE